jgi:hypothetical protein
MTRRSQADLAEAEHVELGITGGWIPTRWPKLKRAWRLQSGSEQVQADVDALTLKATIPELW